MLLIRDGKQLLIAIIMNDISDRTYNIMYVTCLVRLRQFLTSHLIYSSSQDVVINEPHKDDCRIFNMDSHPARWGNI
jgi:hypothetical protein